MRVCVTIAACLLSLAFVAGAQTHTDILRGHVRSDSGASLSAAQVIATRAPDRAIFRTSTDEQGRFEIVIAEGTGDYLVHVSMPGDSPRSVFRKRITRATATDSIFVLDVILKSVAPAQLAAVKVVATRPTPKRDAPLIGVLETGNNAEFATGVAAMLAPADRGNISAAVTALPGVSAVDGGFSVLGLPPDQNRTTLNGMTFSGGTLPSNARTFTSVSSSPFDPSHGGFGGAEVQVNIMPGEMYSTASASGSLDAPQLQSSGGLERGGEGKPTSIRGGWGQSGMTLDDRVAYSYAVEGQRRSADRLTWANARPTTWVRAGVSPDSMSRLLGVLADHGIPTSALMGPPGTVASDASLIARINTPWFDPKSFTENRHSVGVIVGGAHGRTSGASAGPVTAATGSLTTERSNLTVQGMYTGYLTPDFLQDIKLAFNLSSNRVVPALGIPLGQVLIASSADGGDVGLASAAFGNAGGLSRNRSATIELQSESKFYPARSLVHQLKVNAGLRYDTERQQLPGNEHGLFVFNSIDDLAQGTPAAFVRSLRSPDRAADLLSGFVSVGDFWRASPELQLVYGIRAELNRFGHLPAYNAAVERSLQVRNDFAPNRVHASPRLGFTWRYNHAREFAGYSTNALGTFPSLLTGVLRGGIGEFRAAMPPALLAGPSAFTGLPQGAQQVACIGDAVPTPDWGTYYADRSSIPTSCADASAATFVDRTPMVQLIDPAFDAPRSWRANLAWTTKLPGHVTTTLAGTYSLNLDQRSREDLNFAGIPHFRLSDEGRPVFVDPSAIVSTSGLMSTVTARRDPALGQVLSLKSDMSGHSAQLSVSASRSWGSRWFGALGYAWQSVRVRQRGFEASTFESPRDASWSRGAGDIRHDFVLQAGHNGRILNVTMYGRLTSGTPYTPLVAGDVNGDGNSSNDRAFMFDPARTSDTSLARGLNDLLAGAAPSVRRCLSRQLGAPTARNSCEGPWTARLNAQVGLNPGLLPAALRNWNVSLYLANPLAGVDQLLHGSRLHGWGSPTAVDPTLMRVVGFDASSRTMRYAVNPRFGTSQPGAAWLQAPFRVTLSVRVDLSKPVPEQQLERFLMPGRAGHKGKRLTAEELKIRYSHNLIDPFREVLQLSDSLLLQREQVEALRDAQAQLARRADSAWTALAKEFAALPDDFDARRTLEHQEAVIDSVYDLVRVEVRRVLPSVLTPVQLRLLPPLTRYLLEHEGPLRRAPTRY
jgi:hypothetical protein